MLNMLSNRYKCPDLSELEPILKIPDKHMDHPSIKPIKAKSNSQIFKFSQIDIKEVKKSFQSLDPVKAAQKDDIKANLLKKNVDFLQNAHVMTSMILPNVFKIYERCLSDQIATYYKHIFLDINAVFSRVIVFNNVC